MIQVKLAEQLEQEGADVIQTEGGKCSSPSKAGVLGLIEKVLCLQTFLMKKTEKKGNLA